MAQYKVTSIIDGKERVYDGSMFGWCSESADLETAFDEFTNLVKHTLIMRGCMIRAQHEGVDYHSSAALQLVESATNKIMARLEFGPSHVGEESVSHT